VFKGIALFTPGGDLVYCIDPVKQEHWHLHLCAFLGELLGLPEPPHFLVPCYTATVDRWLDAATGQIKTVGEAAPAVFKHQPLLNALFATEGLVWQEMPIPEELGNPIVLASHRKQFPQLWEAHDLLARYSGAGTPSSESRTQPARDEAVSQPSLQAQGYVLRLFVAGNNAATERILQTLHQLLEQSLCQPYTLKVVDVTKHPDLAEQDQVSATPTLVKVWPPPVRRIVGGLESVDQIVRLLGSMESHSNFPIP
jgi:circadian clock protein KaiB